VQNKMQKGAQMSQDLYRPSLNEENSKCTITYPIDNFFYVAFFGGVIPLVVLGTRNARWLKIDKWIQYVLIGLGIVILLSKIAIVSLVSQKVLVIESRYIKYSYKIASVLLYLLYYDVMKKKFRQHMLFGDEEPLFIEALVWILVGAVVESILLMVGGLVISHVV
jgi:hypothetical protein